MNYSAEQILHVYKQVKKEKSEALSKLKYIKAKSAYGDLILQVIELFTEEGDENLKFKVVGYGGVRFLGNINGKVPTQGLYYKNANIKEEAERLIMSLDVTQADKQGAVKYISEQHGTPKPQHCILWQMA